MNIYLIGVGGQGIGLLSEILIRAADHAGLKVKGVDTHGLAQRGGIVVSHLRLGDKVYSPIVSDGEADMVIALERHETLRAMNGFLKDNGTLIYYNASWQPLEVRLKMAEEVTINAIDKECKKRGIRNIEVFNEELKDPRRQNIVVIAHIVKLNLIPEIDANHITEAMEDLMEGAMLKQNIQLFKKEISME